MPTDLVIVDLNADANLDIIVIKQTDQNLSVLMGKADGTFLPPVHYSLGELATSWPIGIAASDFNSDVSPTSRS